MPYIDQDKRLVLDARIDDLLDRWYFMTKLDVAGEFTYVIYRLLKLFSGRYWMRALGLGCMLCAMLEMYRRDHAVYEDEKEKINGSV